MENLLLFNMAAIIIAVTVINEGIVTLEMTFFFFKLLFDVY